MKKGLLSLFLLLAIAGFSQGQKNLRTLTQKSAALSDTLIAQNGTTQATTAQSYYNLFGVGSKLTSSDTSFLHNQIAQNNAAIAANTTAIAGKLTASNNLSDLSSVPTARTNLGLGAMATKNSLTTGDIPDLSGTYAAAFTSTAIKTSAYTAAVNDLVKTDATSGNVPVTLPAAPADKARVAVKMIGVSGTNTTTIATGGSAVFNKAGGSTSITLTLLNHGLVFQYEAATGIWNVVSGDIPLSGLDARFGTLAQQTTNTAAIATKIPIANYIVRETPTGTTNGSNTTFTLANPPVSGKEMVFLNGILQYLTDDYTISSNTITFIVAPRSTDKIRVTYIY